ncbi:hypothetical protein SLA2020_252250 [Shorea laevis]
MDFCYFRDIVKRAVRIRKQNCAGPNSTLDADALVNNIDNAIDKALKEGCETQEVMNWMLMVEDLEYIILSGLRKEFENKGKKCCFGWFPNLKSQLQLSMEADKYVQDVAELLKKIRTTREEALSKTEQKVVAAAVKDFEHFDSRRDVWEEIMVALQSPRISSIGVYGKAGVGKTMLVEEIKRKAKQMKLFDDVVMAKVTNNPDMRRIQNDIAHDLGLELPDRVTGTDQIRSKLTNRKLLVILDDIWARIDLEEVGIPFGIKHKQKLKQPTEKKNEEISSVKEQKECILLMTSRDRDVLSRDMDAHKIVEVKQLEEREAWELFEKIAGEKAKNRILQRTAEKNEKIEGEQPIEGLEEIFQHCNRLPIAIATLASTLENKSLIQWRTTITKLRSQMSSKLEENLNGISPSLCSAVELRYGDLESNQLQQTLLLCGLMGHNASIQDLLKYGIGLNLFPDAANIEAARDEAVHSVGKLRKTFLLLDGGSNMHFDMHDLIQEVAILIASGEHDVLALRKDAAKKKLDQEELKKSKWIYLSNVDAAQLPYRLKCPQLTLFHLANNNPDFEISDKFFRGADRLSVLGLTRMHFLSIPSSISLLVNLRTLRLDQSGLGTNLGSIMGALKNLQVLSLVGCDIKELPEETKELGKLTLLDLSDCSQLMVIPPDVLKSLSQLEELYLGNSFDQWEDVKKQDKRNASLDELTQLENLTSLEVRIHEINMIPDDLFSIELNRYKICIGDVWNNWGSPFEHSKILKLKHDGSIRSDQVEKLPKKVEELHLEKLNAVKDVFNELHQKDFQELKYLHVKNIDLEIEHLFFNPEKENYNEVLPKLEELFLHSLKGLQKIFHGEFENSSLEKLRILTVTGCNRLKNLFSFSVAKQLHNLRKIIVTDCSDIVEIVDDEEEEDANVRTAEAAGDVIELAAQIQCLRLQRLTAFISFNQEKIIKFRSTLLFNKKVHI